MKNDEESKDKMQEVREHDTLQTKTQENVATKHDNKGLPTQSDRKVSDCDKQVPESDIKHSGDKRSQHREKAIP